jgi:PilZ domain-containing protein
MNRRNHPVSVAPYPIDRAPRVKTMIDDDSAEWDAKWLRPNVTRIPEKPVKVIQKRAVASLAPAPPSAPARVDEAQEATNDPTYLRFLRWLFPEVNQRRAKRYATSNLVAYYWTGGAPFSYQVGDISATGVFLLTKERWAPGTLIQMTLQPQSGKVSNDNSISVLSEVVRWGENGSGFNFILKDYENVMNYGIQPNEAVDRRTVERFLNKVGVPSHR